MTIVDIIVSTALIFKNVRGSNIKCAIAFKQGLLGCSEFKRELWRVRKS